MSMIDFKKQCQEFLEKHDKKLCVSFTYKIDILRIWKNDQTGFYDPYYLGVFNQYLKFKDKDYIKIYYDEYSKEEKCFVETRNRVYLLNEEELDKMTDYEEMVYFFIKVLYFEEYGEEIDEESFPLISFNDIIYFS